MPYGTCVCAHCKSSKQFRSVMEASIVFSRKHSPFWAPPRYIRWASSPPPGRVSSTWRPSYFNILLRLSSLGVAYKARPTRSTMFEGFKVFDRMRANMPKGAIFTNEQRPKTGTLYYATKGHPGRVKCVVFVFVVLCVMTVFDAVAHGYHRCCS